LKDIISGLEKNYDYILIDSPAGLEHLNRRVTSSVNTIFAIVDASKKSIENIKRSYKIISEVKIKFENFYVVGNYTFPECEDREFFTDVSEGDVKYVGKIQYDDAVREYMMLGKSLLEIEKTSPAFISVAEIAKKTNIVVL
jgi:CO dehydrogenase maturation factor